VILGEAILQANPNTNPKQYLLSPVVIGV